MGETKQRVAAKAVLIHDGKFLLVKKVEERADKEFGLWEIPGGKVEYGEHVKDALHREIQEELGMEAEIGQPIAVWDFIQDGSTHLIGITFLAKALTTQVNLSSEHQTYNWFSPEELSGLNLHKPVKKEIEQAFRILADV